MTVPKVGDMVAWADVPDGALVRAEFEDDGVVHAARHAGRGLWVHCESRSVPWPKTVSIELFGWDWGTEGPPEAERVTIVALDLTGQETAADLQRLAEVFEANERMEAAERASKSDGAARIMCTDCGELHVTRQDCPAERVRAEIADVRHALDADSAVWLGAMIGVREGRDDNEPPPDLDDLAERLHALGWRKSQTAEDAARLLAEWASGR